MKRIVTDIGLTINSAHFKKEKQEIILEPPFSCSQKAVCYFLERGVPGDNRELCKTKEESCLEEDLAHHQVGRIISGVK